MKRLLIALGCVLAGLVVGWSVSAQVTQVFQGMLQGTEAWQVGIGGPAGPGFYTNVNGVRNGETYALIGAGTTVTTTVSPNVSRVIVTGAITTLNLSLPTAPFDGQRVIVSCPGGTVSTLTISAPTINGVANAATLANGIVGGLPTTCGSTPTVSESIVLQFTAPTSWWRVQ